jgi:mRNA interferase MazF
VAKGQVRRFEVFYATLDPVIGSEMAKTRPVVVVSPGSMNSTLRTVIIAPVTSTQRGWPFRVTAKVNKRTADIALDQIRTLDKTRLLRRLGRLQPEIARAVSETLVEMFAWGED